MQSYLTTGIAYSRGLLRASRLALVTSVTKMSSLLSGMPGRRGGVAVKWQSLGASAPPRLLPASGMSREVARLFSCLFFGSIPRHFGGYVSSAQPVVPMTVMPLFTPFTPGFRHITRVSPLVGAERRDMTSPDGSGRRL